MSPRRLAICVAVLGRNHGFASPISRLGASASLVTPPTPSALSPRGRNGARRETVGNGVGTVVFISLPDTFSLTRRCRVVGGSAWNRHASGCGFSWRSRHLGWRRSRLAKMLSGRQGTVPCFGRCVVATTGRISRKTDQSPRRSPGGHWVLFFQGPPFILNSNSGAMFFLFHAFHASCIRATICGCAAARSCSSSTSAARL